MNKIDNGWTLCVVSSILCDYLDFKSVGCLLRCSKQLNIFTKQHGVFIKPNKYIIKQINTWGYYNVFARVEERKIIEFINEKRCMFCYETCNEEINKDFGTYTHARCLFRSLKLKDYLEHKDDIEDKPSTIRRTVSKYERGRGFHTEETRFVLHGYCPNVNPSYVVDSYHEKCVKIQKEFEENKQKVIEDESRKVETPKIFYSRNEEAKAFLRDSDYQTRILFTHIYSSCHHKWELDQKQNRGSNKLLYDFISLEEEQEILEYIKTKSARNNRIYQNKF